MDKRLLIFGVISLAAPLGALATDDAAQVPAPKKSYYVDLAGNEDDAPKTPKTAPKTKADRDSVAKLEAKTFQLINEARNANGAEAVTLNKKLSDLARTYAQRLLAEKFFSHVDPAGVGAQERANNAGIKCGVYENLGWQSGDDSSMEKVIDLHQSFLNEPPDQKNHRHILLHPKHLFVGVGIAKSGDELALVQEYTDENPDEAH